jgi:hypothetical protein
MADRTCTKCNKIFIYPSELKKHLKYTINCKKSNEEINNFFSQIKQNKEENKKNGFMCNKCNSIFVQKCTLTRHINTSKCNKEQFERKKQIELLQKQIDQLKEQPLRIHSQLQVQPQVQIQAQLQVQTQTQTQTQLQNQQLQQQPQILNQIENQTINNINNNLTINNNITIIQHINPSGNETLPSNLTKQQMIRLLNMGDEGVIEIVKLVCEQDENKNFFKLNMNKNNISYLNNNYKIDICQDKELKDKLLKQCVILTYKMLISCSPSMSSDEICAINSNLQNISKKIKEEIYDNGLKNIIEYELRNNSKLTKDKITKYTQEINNNQELKEQAQINYGKVLQIKQDTNKHKLPAITLYEINNKFGNPLTLEELKTEFTFNEFNTKRYEYTTYYKYWHKRIQDETEFIMSHPNKTIGDITSFDNRKNNIKDNIEKMEVINNKMRDVDENNNMVITLNNFKVEIAIDYITEHNRVTLYN